MNHEPNRKPLDSAGTIATARRLSGQHATPAEGFAFDVASLDDAVRALIRRADEEGWSIDLDAIAGI